MSIEANVDNVVQNIELIVGEGKVTTVNIMSMCISAMQCVERIPSLSGADKKALVIRALTKVLQDKGGDLALLALIPDCIDTMVSVEKGKITITITPEDVVGCCGLCGKSA